MSEDTADIQQDYIPQHPREAPKWIPLQDPAWGQKKAATRSAGSPKKQIPLQPLPDIDSMFESILNC